MASNDDLPVAYLARVPFPAEGQVSGVLVPRSMEFLAVQLLLDGYLMVGRTVAFFECTDDEEKGELLDDPVLSDNDGIARLPRVVPTGHYLCEVEGHATTIVTTVDRLDESCALHLPIDSEAVAHTSAVSILDTDGDDSDDADFGATGEDQ